MIRFLAGIILAALIIFGGQIVCPEQAEHSGQQGLSWQQGSPDALKHQPEKSSKAADHCLSSRLQANAYSLIPTRVELPATYSFVDHSATGTRHLPPHRPPII